MEILDLFSAKFKQASAKAREIFKIAAIEKTRSALLLTERLRRFHASLGCTQQR